MYLVSQVFILLCILLLILRVYLIFRDFHFDECDDSLFRHDQLLCKHQVILDYINSFLIVCDRLSQFIELLFSLLDFLVSLSFTQGVFCEVSCSLLLFYHSLLFKDIALCLFKLFMIFEYRFVLQISIETVFDKTHEIRNFELFVNYAIFLRL